MSFKFRFLSILDLRRRQRDEAGVSVGKANQAIAKIDEQIAEIQSKLASVRNESTHGRVGNVSVERLLSTGRFEMQLGADIGRLQSTRSELEQELDRRQSVLVAAEAEVKRFERLEANERETHHAEMLRHEQADADERSNQAFILARRKSAS